MKLRSFSLIFVFMFLISGFAYAARPLKTDDTGTTPLDRWKLEAFGESYDTVNSIGLVGKFGVSDNVEASIGGSLASTGSTTARGPVTAKVKWRMVDENGETPSFGVAGSLSIPDAGDSTYKINGILTDTLSNFTYHMNIGLEIIGSVSGLSYSGAVDYPLNNEVNIVAEVNGAHTGTAAWALSSLIGYKWKMNSSMTFDSGIRLSMNENASSGFTLGLTILL